MSIGGNFSFQNCGWPFSAQANTAQAKNSDKQSWKEGFHAANGKAEHALAGWAGVGGRGAGYFLFFFIVQSRPVQLAQAKNSDPEVWKRKIHASNG